MKKMVMGVMGLIGAVAAGDPLPMNPATADFDGDGVSEVWETQLGMNKSRKDSDACAVGDVCAAATVGAYVFTATNGTAATRYVVRGEGTNAVGYTTWTNGTASGEIYVGRVLTSGEWTAATNRFAWGVWSTNVVALHSAVCDWYGYDATTARVGGTNTVDFTAWLKYLTQRYYLAEVGTTNDFQLKVGRVSTKKMAVPDGLLLYTQYATVSLGDDTAADDTTSVATQPTVAEWCAGMTNAVAGDTMAWEDVAMPLVAVGTDEVATNWTWYAVTALGKEDADIRTTGGALVRGTSARRLRTTARTYDYGGCVGLGCAYTNFAAAAKVKATSNATVRLVHAQVYAANGYDAGACDKPFTRADKLLVPRYLAAQGVTGVTADPFTYADGAWGVRTETAYNLYWNNRADSDLDGIADGWELYTMFGIEGAKVGGKATSALDLFVANPLAKMTGTALADLAISPYNPDDAQQLSPGDKTTYDAGKPDNSALLDEGYTQAEVDAYNANDLITYNATISNALLTLNQEYDSGYWSTDPWRTDTDDDNVADGYARYYHLKGEDAGEDWDGDGLSNYAEYLVSEVFKFAQLDPDEANTDGSTRDYFRRFGNLYLGEMFTDHDGVDDRYEQAHAGATNRGAYDAGADLDGDGWSNWAEAKAGTDPALVASPGVDGEPLPEYPIPTIAATVKYSGKQKLSGDIIFRCWGTGDAAMSGQPDAQWQTGVGTSTNVTRYVGKNPGKEVTYRIGTGVIAPGSVKVYFLDMAFEKANIVNGVEQYSYRGEVGDARWYYFVQDYNGDLYTTATNQTPVKVGTVDYKTGVLKIDYGCEALQGVAYDSAVNGEQSTVDYDTKNVAVYSNYNKLDLGNSYVKFQWTPMRVAESGNVTYYLSEARGGKGHVTEGANKFVAWCDLDGDEEYTPGEPFGFVRGVDVGWQGGAFTVELTETSAVFARIYLKMTSGAESESSAVVSDRQYWQDGNSGVYPLQGSTLTTVKSVVGATAVADATNVTSRLTRIRVMRILVNGKSTWGVDKNGYDVSVKQVVLDKYLDLGTRSYLHEGDFLEDGVYGCDWDYLRGDLSTKVVYDKSDRVNPISIDPTSVTYAIVLGEGDIGLTTSNTVYRYVVNNVFDTATVRLASNLNSLSASTVRPVIDPTTPQDYVYGATPTFRWAMRDGNGVNYNTYTAFRIVISNSNATAGYDTGYRDLPACDENGWYSWTLDRPLGAKFGNGAYTWKVAMYNAKYADDTTWETINRTFAYNEATGMKQVTWSGEGVLVVNMNNQQPMNDHGYSTIAAAVKYAGPSTVSGSSVLVQAYATEDFAGSPVAAGYVGSAVTNGSAKANVTLKGIPQTGTYYVRAFIDQDGDGEKDDWESWGAGEEAVVLSATDAEQPTVGVWIEDADTDGDWLPDAWEMAQSGNLTTRYGTVYDGDKILLSGTYSGTAGISTRLTGATLTAFHNRTFISTLLGLSGSVSISSIRSSVANRIKTTDRALTSYVLSADGTKVTLTFDSAVTDSIAGEVMGMIYAPEKTVTVRIYRKENLAQAGWTLACTRTATLTSSTSDVDVSVSGLNLRTGYYKVEVE